MEGKDISAEAWRSYTWQDGHVTIENPILLFTGKTSHRVTDSTGCVYIVPSVGTFGCYIRYKPKDITNPVQF